jgi:NAD(P)-dependent dehydrogenase (short-subunit alcohol dehydrogenase family)
MTRYEHIDVSQSVVAITGGAQGIGRATAERFAAAGARVAIGDLDLELAEKTAARYGGTAHRLDVSDPDSGRDDRALHPDQVERAAYQARLADQAGEQS